MINLQQLDQLAMVAGVDMWEGLTVPDECERLDADVLKSSCFERCGLNIPIYPDPDTFRAAVTLWSKKNQYTFLHIDKIMASEYSPIENVFEDKETSRKFDGKTDTTGKTAGTNSKSRNGSDTEKLTNDITSLAHGKVTTEGGTDNNDTTNTTSAYDVNTYSPDNKSENQIRYGHTSTDSGTDTTTRNYTKTNAMNGAESGKNETSSTGKELKDDTEKITEKRHGNIGITSANKLQIEEYNMLAEFNPYNFLAELFERDLTLCIY